MSLKYLVTGATGGLGAQVLSHLAANLPASEYAAASSNAGNRQKFEDQGIAFRVANYDDPQTLETAFENVENVLFVSSNTFDVQKREKQHQNFIDAAKKVNVKHVWYTSLAFGGFGSDSKADVQRAHLITEDMMRKADINFTSVREGLYTDAFPVFMGWYPSTEKVYVAGDGPIAFTLRAELGEATARLMIRGGHDKEIVLLTAQETITFSEVVDLINKTTGRQVQFEIVSPEESVRIHASNDLGGKPEGFFRALVTWDQAIAKGDAGITDPLMSELLGREPTSPRAAIEAFLKEDPDYKWHQNYVNQA